MNFPFYTMNVKEYEVLIDKAALAEKKEKANALPEHVRLESLQKKFSGHSSWDALNDTNSDLVKLLTNTTKFSVIHLKLIGLLWCEGSNEAKVDVFYDLISDKTSKTLKHDYLRLK